MIKMPEKEFEEYVPHTDCARIALFGNYKDIHCESCRQYYATQELKRQEKWFNSLGRTVPTDIVSTCFSQI